MEHRRAGPGRRADGADAPALRPDRPAGGSGENRLGAPPLLGERPLPAASDPGTSPPWAVAGGRTAGAGSPADDSEALQGVLRAELDRLEAKAGELAGTIAQVRNLLNRMDGRRAGPDLLMKSVEVHTMLEGYFTDDQRQRIVDRRDSMGSRAGHQAADRVGGAVQEIERQAGGRLRRPPRFLTHRLCRPAGCSTRTGT